MKRFVEGDSRTQSFLLPEALEDYVTDTNPVRVVDVFVDELDLRNSYLRASSQRRPAGLRIIRR